MPLDMKNELKKVRDYYENDPLQQRFSALITGETGSGKSYLLRTARRPVHVDSFDPGGTKCYRDLIKSGDIIADTRWENEDPYEPHVFADWMEETKYRMNNRYFDKFGTYALDSASSWGDAAMNYQLRGAKRAGQAPMFRRDYTPQKVFMVNFTKKLMTLTCDFLLMGHLKTIEEVIGHDKEGEPKVRIKYRFLTTGQAVVSIPMQFDELYVLIGEETSDGIKRHLLIEAQGTYLARSRLKANGKLNAKEEPDIRKLLKKIGVPWEDKPKLVI